MANHPSDAGKKNRSLREMMNDNNGRAPASPSSLRGKPVAEDDPWGDKDEDPAASLDQTSDQEHEEILRRVRNQQGGVEQRVPTKDESKAEPPRHSLESDAGDVDKILAENQQLQEMVAELKQCLEEATAKNKGGDGSFEDREREYEMLLDEKTDTIRQLHVRIQELEKQLAEGGGGGGGDAKPSGGDREASGNQEEMLALSDELERERCQLEQERQAVDGDRRQLREDEDAMMRQMREMELQMAKERAELARQRNELQRLHSEIRHELELAQRDAAVNERLRLLQRRHNEVSSGGGSGGDDEPPAKASGQTPASKQPPKKDKDSGSGSKSIMKRFFGGGK
jgi:hypothetical protein